VIAMTVTGRTLAENMEHVRWNDEQDVVYPANKPITVTGGVVGLKGNLAEDGAIVKVAGMVEAEFQRSRRVVSIRKKIASMPSQIAITRKATFL